jgi:uncharacterized membrane protein YkvI
MKRIHFSLALAKWHEWLVYLTIGLLTATGLAWLWLDKFGKVQGDFGPEQNPALPWLLLLHGVIAYAFLIVSAMLVPVHMRLGWNALRNRLSGLALVTVGLFLAATGLLLYYATAEGLRDASSTLHWIVGIGLPAILIIHVVRGRRSRSSPPEVR